ncbi:hypothetical protein KVR01_006110 [Diaporthe batatas]|uniref:uncharacterized protein n=1 Tax=Diaporthe batatas TaxID=748121 RepID=UPI001D04FA68|nr:uncharacterized protein KVR01_006110 [Diaporthe batatas]KAG8164192.1 hypothetical protein KVR01_006110 [Diaporthe batatas]
MRSAGWPLYLVQVLCLCLCRIGAGRDLRVLQRRNLDQLNSTVGGRLRASQPLAAPCYQEPDGEACASYREALSSGKPAFYRTSRYEGFQYLQGEACASRPSDQCMLDPATLEPVQNSTCGLGVLSPTYLEITGADDVQAVFAYARRTGTALSIKNSGHDYVGRSSRRGSLAIWTRGLRNMTYDASFLPDGATYRVHPVPALTLGAGVSTDESYDFAHSKGVLFAGPVVGSIGPVGGWSLNGGNGVLTGSRGLGADRLLQSTIVTPDGEVRIANKYTNTDLYWALRGGGGGAFGVVLDSTFEVEPERPITAATIFFPGTADNQRPFVDILAQNMVRWSLEGWGGPSGTNLTFLSNPYLNEKEAALSLAPAIEYATSQGGSAAISVWPTYYEYYVAVVNGSLAAPEPISNAGLITSRTISVEVLSNTASRERVVDTIMASQNAGVPVNMLTTPPLRYAADHEGAEEEVSMHSAWYESAWLVVAQTAFTPSTPLSVRETLASSLHNVTLALDAASPDGATYGNEADWWLQDWAEHIWGAKYARLLDIKKFIDPDGLLACWHCVGWEDSLPGYECLADLSPY